MRREHGGRVFGKSVEICYNIAELRGTELERDLTLLGCRSVADTGPNTVRGVPV